MQWTCIVVGWARVEVSNWGWFDLVLCHLQGVYWVASEVGVLLLLLQMQT
jgi:hypothetical protein